MHCLHHNTAPQPSTWRKTASYYLMHMVVASLVGYAVTGHWQTALALSLLEPTVQTVAYVLHDKAWARVLPYRGRMLVKTGSYYLLHMGVAAVVAYAVTGDWLQALTMSLLEPTVQMVFFYLHETLWERRTQRQAALSDAVQA